ncbi:class I SAM-dependent methyltransferase [Desulfolutivibrio sp.]|uniref:class I SAM-dependent methyltransferase n=1 Tax=Desulfolutivibrio sp. TaxID=2773296 RepID=UPI002F96A2EB
MSDAYWKTAGRVPSTLDVDPAFAALIGPGDALLDMGCGDGRTLAEMAERAKCGPGVGGRDSGPLWAGVDVNSPSLAAGQGRGLPGTAFVRGELARLPFADKSFDYGIMHAVLTTLDTPTVRRMVLAEAARVLRCGMTISDFLLTPEIPLYRERYERGFGETGEWGTFRVMEGERYLYTAHHYTIEEIEELMREAGFCRTRLRQVQSQTRSGNRINGVVGQVFLR